MFSLSLRALWLAIPITFFAACAAPPPPRHAKVEAQGRVIGKMTSEGTAVAMSDAAVKDIRKRTVDCYSSALKNNPDTEGEVDFLLALADDGNVAGSKIEPHGAWDPLFVECVEGALQSMRFEHAGGPTAKVEGKLTFVRTH